MAKTKKQEKSMEAILWDSANKLRGTVESSNTKCRPRVSIFLKFASDKFEERRMELISEGKEKYLEMREFYNMKNVFFLPIEDLRWSHIIANSKQDNISLLIEKYCPEHRREEHTRHQAFHKRTLWTLLTVMDVSKLTLGQPSTTLTLPKTRNRTSWGVCMNTSSASLP